MPILDFESGIAGWTTSNEDITLSVETSMVHSGTQAMRIQAPATPAYDTSWVDYTIPSLAPGYYRMTFWTQSKTDPAPYGNYVYLMAAPQTRRHAVPAGVGSWGNNESNPLIVYQPIAGELVVRLQFYQSGWQFPSGLDVVVDDIAVEFISETMSTDFESGNPLWDGYGNVISEVVANSPTHSVEKDPNGTSSFGPTYGLPWCPGLTHTFTAQVYNPAANSDAVWGINSWWLDQQWPAEYYVTTSVKDAWTPLEVTLTGEQITYGDLFYSFDLLHDSGFAETTYVDDIVHTITGTPGGAVRIDDFEPYVVGLIYQNDPADPGYYWWDNWGDEVIEVVDTFADTGTKSFHVVLPANENRAGPDGAPGIWNRNALSTYIDLNYYPAGFKSMTITARVWVESGSAPVSLQAWNEYSQDWETVDAVMQRSESTTTGAWETLSITLTDDEVFLMYGDFYLTTDAPNSVCEFYVDNVRAEIEIAIPNLSLDVTLDGELTSSIPAPEGELGLDVDMYYAGPTPVEATLNLDVGLEALLATSLPLADGSFDVVVGLSATAIIVYNFSVGGTVSADVGLDASVVWGGDTLRPESTLSIDVETQGSTYDHIVLTPSGGSWYGLSSGAYYQNDPTYVAPNYSSITTDNSVFFDGSSSERVNTAARPTPIHESWVYVHPQAICSWPGTGFDQRYPYGFGYTITLSARVMVTSGGPVKLQAATFYQRVSQVLSNSDPVRTVLRETATTTTGVWELLTLQITPEESADLNGPLFCFYPDQTMASVFHVDALQITYSGQRTTNSGVDTYDQPNSPFYHSKIAEYGEVALYYDPVGSHYVSTYWGGYGEPGNGWRMVTQDTSGPPNQVILYMSQGEQNQYWLADTNWVTQFAFRIKVAPGGSPVRFGARGGMFDISSGNYQNWPGVHFPASREAVTTTTGEWETISLRVPYNLQSRYSDAVNPLYTPHTWTFWIGFWQESGEYQLDTFTYTDVRSTSFDLPVTNSDPNRGAPIVPVSLEATLGEYDFNQDGGTGSVTVDVQLVATPTVLISVTSSITVDVEFPSALHSLTGTLAVEGTLSLDLQPAKSWRWAEDWDIEGNTQWKPTWSPYQTPGFEGYGNDSWYDMDYWDVEYWNRPAYPTVGYYNPYDEWYMAYPWEYVHAGVRSGKFTIPAWTPEQWGAYMACSYRAPCPHTLLTRFVVWIYNPPGNPALEVRAVARWKIPNSYSYGPGNVLTYLPTPDPDDIPGAVLAKALTQTHGQWEKVVLTIDPREHVFAPATYSGYPYPTTTVYQPNQTTKQYEALFEILPPSSEQGQGNEFTFYLDDYEFFYDTIEDPKIGYLRSTP
jgi:hypothetical protein